MFRAIAFSVVLTIAAGPTAALACRTVCHTAADAAAACEHDARSGVSVAPGSACDDLGIAGVAFLKEDVHTVPAPDDADTWMSPGGLHAPAAPLASVPLVPAPVAQASNRPLMTVLRI